MPVRDYALARGVSHHYDEYPDKHDWPFWNEHAVESLDFLAEHLTAAEG
ncbi:MAG: hypothetical protein ACRDG4_05025 [Chloroflexota bacterium]